MANPQRYLFLIKISCQCQNVLIGMSGQCLMLCIIDVFDIQQKQIADRKQFIKFFEECLRLAKGLSAGVNGRMNSLFLGFLEQF